MRSPKSFVWLNVPLCAVALGLSLTGCGRHSKKETFYLISNNLKLPYWKAVNAGFEKAAAEYGVTPQLAGPDTFDVQAEQDAFRKAVASKPAGILVSVVNAGAMKQEIDDAIAGGLPVITVDSDAPTSSRLFFIGTDNFAAGQLGGRRLVQRLGQKGRVVFFSMPGEPNLDDRLKGYLDVLNEHPGMKVVDVFDIKGDASTAMEKANEYLALKGDQKIDAFVCLESAAGKEVAEALKRANATDRTLIAMDVDPDTLNLIKDSGIDSTVAQKPFTMGYVGLQMLDQVNHSAHESFRPNYQVDSFSPYPVFVDTGTALVSKDNVDIYLNRAASAEGK